MPDWGSNFTPLTLAITRDCGIHLVEIFLAKGAGVNTKDRDKFSPLAMAIMDEKIEIVHDLVHKHGADPLITYKLDDVDVKL